VDGPTYRALRIVMRPVGYGALGSYRISIPGSVSAVLPAGSDIYQSRWTSVNYALIWGVQVSYAMATNFNFGSAEAFKLQTIFSRSWTIDGSGGTTANLTGDSNKLRTSMASSSMGSIRIASSGALGTGTKTNDVQSLGNVLGVIPATIYTSFSSLPACLYGAVSLEDGGNPAPLVLAKNEGVTIQATVPATGGYWQFGVTMAWSEVASY